MKQEQTKIWESDIYLVSPDVFEKQLLIASLIYQSNMDTMMINGREMHLALTDSKNETAEGANYIFDHIMKMNEVEMYGDIDGAFRRVRKDKLQNTLSIQLRSVRDIRAGSDDTLCGRLKINGITDTDLTSISEEKIPRTVVIMLDADKIVKHDSRDSAFFTDTLRMFLECSSELAVVTAIGRAEKYLDACPDGSEADLILSAKKLYPEMFELIDCFTLLLKGGIAIHKETVYAAANKDIKKLYNANGHGALLEDIEYVPWGIDETFKKIAYCSAYVDLKAINKTIKENENLLLKRIGAFQRGNVRAHINVVEARKRLSRYLIYKYPLDNSLKYFADTV